MPYILPKDRPQFVKVLELFPELSNGELRYIFTILAKRFINADKFIFQHPKPELDAILNQLPKYNIGDMNFMVTWLTHKHVVLRGLKYAVLNNLYGVLLKMAALFRDWHDDNMIGVFGSAASEFYDRIMRPYEDKKIRENGPVSELERELNDV